MIPNAEPRLPVQLLPVRRSQPILQEPSSRA
jgi:hypothetical protein